MTLFRRARQLARKQYEAQSGLDPVHDNPLAALFREQVAVVQDPSRFKALLCGRRAGKTGTALYDFADGMLHEPGSLNLYVALTMPSAREILWEPFKRANEKHRWGFVFDEAKMIVKHANGSRLLVRGADDVRELEKFRGVGFRRIRIDECGAHRPSYLKYLVEEVLEATLMDTGGDVWLMGTCTAQAYGYFHDITTGRVSGYSVHRWTAAANPHVDFYTFVYAPETGLLARRGWTEDNPIFRREYLAEWVVDSTRLVYRFTRERNTVERLPELQHGDSWLRVLGLDFGVGHHTAAALLCYPKQYGRDVYVEKIWRKTGLAPSDACAMIEELFVKPFAPQVIVGDVGGMGKSYQAEWNKHFGGRVPMKAAEKDAKRAALEFTSDALHTAVSKGGSQHRRGLMSLFENEDLHREWATLQWNEERSDIADGQDDDVSHAAMYAYRETPAFSNALLPELIEPRITDSTAEVWGHQPHIPTHHRNLAKNWRNPR